MEIHQPAGVAESRPRLLLVGNPNVGKSVLFKNLTGRYVTVSNYPGTTVEVARASSTWDAGATEVVDTPGVNDLDQANEEGRATREMLARHPDALVVQVADAKNLRRALLLTLQLAERRRSSVLVLNMMDELEARGGRIDLEALSERLGVPVVTTIASEGRGTDDVIRALPTGSRLAVDQGLVAKLEDAYARNRARLEQVNELLQGVFALEQPTQPTFGVRLGFWAMHPVKGLGLLAAVMAGLFWLVGLVGAGTFVDLMEVGLFQQRLNPALLRVADAVLPFPHEHRIEELELTVEIPVSPVHAVPLGSSVREVEVPEYELTGPVVGWRRAARFGHDLLVGEYGLLTMALSYSLAIVLPIVATFFFCFSLLEDSGYLPRMAILVNRLFRAMGLNGKAVLPMVLGLGCATMATMTTRILDTRKERVVTTLLLALAVPCSAQLGVLMAMMTRLSLPAAALWIVLMVAVVFLVGWLTARVFGGGSSDLILEVPPMRRPQLANVTTKTMGRIRWYLVEVIPLFLLGTLLLFVLDRLALLDALARVGRPLVVGWLGLPAETAAAFLVGFLRRDFGAVYLLDATIGPNPALDEHQILVAMVTITLFMPCFATFLMIAREHGRKVVVAMTLFIFPFAFLVGGLIHRLAGWAGL